MKYFFHPAAEAEFLESVGYYESKVPGLGGDEFQALATLIGESPKAWRVELGPDIRSVPLHRFRYRSSTGQNLMVSRCWPLPITAAVRSTGLAGFDPELCRYCCMGATLQHG